MLILNQINGKNPRSFVIVLETMNPYELCYQCFKYGLDFIW